MAWIAVLIVSSEHVLKEMRTERQRRGKDALQGKT